MACPHPLDAAFLYPSDVSILDVDEDVDGRLLVTLALECPECGAALEATAGVSSVEEGDFELPLEDDPYDD